jgi:hypothetical protein
MQCAGHQLLAGAGFPGDHQRQIGLHQTCKHPVDLLHRRRAADQRHAFSGFLGLSCKLSRFRKRAADSADHLGQIKRLWQIIISAAF